jgi:hypothetical protein
MNRNITISLLLFVGLLSVSASYAAYRLDKSLGLKVTEAPLCNKGVQTYNYGITWKDPTNTVRYWITTGNQCSYNGNVCGLNKDDKCIATCSQGQCSATLTDCQYGHGSAKVQVTGVATPSYDVVAPVLPSAPCK